MWALEAPPKYVRVHGEGKNKGASTMRIVKPVVRYGRAERVVVSLNSGVGRAVFNTAMQAKTPTFPRNQITSLQLSDRATGLETHIPVSLGVIPLIKTYQD